MTTNPLTLAVASLLLLAAPLAQSAAPLVPKQLSGPPEEFDAMRVPDPADAAIFSKSALLAVDFDSAGAAQWQTALPVENGRLRFLVFSGSDASWQVHMTNPAGHSELASNLAREVHAAQFGIEQASVPATYYALDNLEKGSWKLDIAGSNANSRGYVLLEGDSATELMSYPTHRRQVVGERLDIVATLNSAATAQETSSGGHLETANLRVTAPDGRISVYPMFDDGQHADAAAGDGVYGGGFSTAQAGNYVAQVIGRGVNAEGQHVLRTAEHVLPVVDASLRLAANESGVGATTDASGRLSLNIAVDARKPDQHYRAYAEIWGHDAKGNAKAVAWISGMVTPKDGVLGLGFDPRWVALARAQAPFELRALRIEDPDHFVSLASADRLALQLPTRRLFADNIVEIDEAMRMGPRPSGARALQGVGQRLLLVHGYCSGGVWPAGQFSSASTFLDVNQNRSHDQFARLIQSFGSTWNSFGTVSHSQGGAASLHLYTYYWSGLDNATGSRLMQSVGTPYKGTNLAGILATLGSWFGVGCGTNDNLSYSGASAWLAGIPTSSRAKVNYYTTAFRSTNWWTNDYCNFATDLVLSDPEDGTTEQTNGQLSGAVNRGHTNGQCHTSGMRDPAQYLDASRNAVLNANAAR